MPKPTNDQVTLNEDPGEDVAAHERKGLRIDDNDPKAELDVDPDGRIHQRDHDSVWS